MAEPGGVNTSMYGTIAGPAAVAPVDALSTIGKVLQIQGASQQLQNQQMEFKARNAMGPILQQSIDPKTGEIDTGRATVLMAAHPDTAWKAPEFVKQLIDNGHVKADTVLKEMQVAKDQWAMRTGVAQGLVTKAIENAASKGHIDSVSGKWISAPPSLSRADLINGLGDLQAIGGIDAKDVVKFLEKNGGEGPEADRQRFQTMDLWMKSGQNIDKGLERITGAINAHKTGGTTQFIKTIPATGEVQNVGGRGIVDTPDIATANRTNPGVNASGQPTINSTADAVALRDANGRPIIGTGGQGASNVTGLSPTELKAAEGRAAKAVDYEEELNTVNTNGTENMRVLGEMKEALKSFKSGGGMEVRQKLAQMADGIGAPKKLVDEIAGGNRGAIAEFQKLAVRYATQEMKTYMGSGQRFTNLDFNTFLKNNPTIDTDPRGLEKMFNFLERGVHRVSEQQKMYQYWKEGHRPQGFEKSDISSFPTFWTSMLKRVDEAK